MPDAHDAPPPQIRQRTLVDEATQLLTESAEDAWGEVSVSEYETARLVAHATWLGGHATRVAFLLERQHEDGSWGPPGGYRLVPTLSAVHALLTCLASPAQDHGVPHDRLLRAVDAGLTALRRLGTSDSPPDTIAVELVIPSLLEGIQHLLDPAHPHSRPAFSQHRGSLVCPGGLDGRTLGALRSHAAAGTPVPGKVWHASETLGLSTEAASHLQPAQGIIGGSAAATATWLTRVAPSQQSDSARRYLEELQHRYSGPVPSITPITYFERAWLLNNFAAAGVPCEAPAALLDSLEAALTPQGAPAGAGLPPDADDTAAVLLALATHGRGRRPEVLMDYRTDGYFQCFIGERTPSISTNAHVLETLGHHVAQHPQDRARYGSAMDTASAWLLAAQKQDGSWLDKWHASPYYATVCCTQALAAHASPATAPARQRAVRWVLATQRSDGGWGLWHSTVEETAYALQILAPPSGGGNIPVQQALTRGRARLCGALPLTPLWHDKDLYTPVRVVRAARAAALYTTRDLLLPPL
ncbi:ent-copalyl diphosphate synthase [Streptomyces clavuligerus]|nr:ent-copalyl diphosphate synthase [Streptomyces clavuligerus]